jgi:hypothetical protein
MSESLHLVPEQSSARTLEQLESVIETRLSAAIECLEALAAIHDGKLYKATHSTWELYCQERWGISRSAAWRQLGQAKAVAELAPGSSPPPQEPAERRAERQRKQNVAERDEMVSPEPNDDQETLKSLFDEAYRLTAENKALKARLDRALGLLDCPHRTRDRDLRCLRCWDQK